MAGPEEERETSPLARPRWFDDLPLSDHVRFFLATNWAESHLGPLQGWSLALRLQVHMLFADSRPATLYWGPHRVAIYNQSFVPLAGKAHPQLMSSTFAQGFPEIWDHFKAVFEAGVTTGLAQDVNEIPLFVERSGYLEETFFTGNFIPVRGDSGLVDGFYNAVHEVTKQKLQDRRTAMLNCIASSESENTESLWGEIVKCLEQNERDVSMALLYQIDEECSPGRSLLRLRGMIGVPNGHKIAVDQADLESSEGVIPLLRQGKFEAITIPADDRFEGIHWQGFQEPARFISVLPLKSVRFFGFLVMGTNPRREIDTSWHQFVNDLGRQLASRIASVVSADESKKREQRLARELAESERQIRYMAQHASVGMQHLSVEGKILWANERYYELTGHLRDIQRQYDFSFFDVVIDEDRVKAHEAWTRLLEGEPHVSTVLRLKRDFNPPSGDPEPACALVLSFPYLEGGKVRSIMSCLTDISRLKWAENWQARNAREAIEAKRQQEEFIDLVSHEMRNPLSAIVQIGESISNSFTDCQAKGKSVSHYKETLSHNVEEAKALLLCANHQKRVIDDVLTLSKFETNMLSFSAEAVRPAKLVEEVLNMYKGQLKSLGIEANALAHDTMVDNNVDWVFCDPSRVTQILINLLANAIKFTAVKGQIIVEYGAVRFDPRKFAPADMFWLSSSRAVEDLTLRTDWGTGEQLYLTFKVKNTGIGLQRSEIKLLFSRFSQASAKTHITYGGHGLGLFISRQLVERQGGQIGVASEPGEWTTFVFYIKCRRAEAPKLDLGPVPVPLRSPHKAESPSSNDLTKPNGKGYPLMWHILLVEDNIINQQVLSRQLTKAGCVIYVANNGLEALETLKTTACWQEHVHDDKALDFILMDLEMPIMDGLACTKMIRTLEKTGKITRHLDLIAVTANVRPEQIQSALAAGADLVISKPVSVSHLIQKMKELRDSCMNIGFDVDELRSTDTALPLPRPGTLASQEAVGDTIFMKKIMKRRKLCWNRKMLPGTKEQEAVAF